MKFIVHLRLYRPISNSYLYISQGFISDNTTKELIQDSIDCYLNINYPEWTIRKILIKETV